MHANIYRHYYFLLILPQSSQPLYIVRSSGTDKRTDIVIPASDYHHFIVLTNFRPMNAIA